MTRILICGYYGLGNLGDEIILSAMTSDMRRQLPGVELQAVSFNPAATIASHSIGAIDMHDLSGLTSAIGASDLVVLGGGGILHDHWGVQPDSFLTPQHEGLALYAGIAALAQALQVPMMAYAVGIGPIRTSEGRGLAGAILTQCDLISVRDTQSANLAEELLPGDHRKTVHITADPGFNLELPMASSAHGETRRERAVGPNLGVVLRYWSGPGVSEDWEAEVAAAFDELVSWQSCRIRFLPMQSNSDRIHEDDLRCAERIRSRMAAADACDLIDVKGDIGELCNQFRALDAVLSMRYHGVLLGLRLGLPVVALAYDRKVSSLIAEAAPGTPWLRPEQWHKERILKAVETVLTNGRVDAPGLQSVEARASETPALAISLLATEADRNPRRDPLLVELLARRLVDAPHTDRLTTRLHQAQANRDSLLVQRNRLRLELDSLRDTFGVRTLQRYWDLMRMLLPEGTRRREWFTIARQLVRRAQAKLFGDVVLRFRPERMTQPSYAGHMTGPSRRSAALSPDPRLALMHFVDRSVGSGGQPFVVICSTTQLIESEGQRPTRLAFTLAEQHVPVVFCYWRWDESEWVRNELLDEGIVQLPVDLLVSHPEDLFDLLPDGEHVLYLAFPHPAFFDVVSRANAAGWIVHYDVLDDWEAFYRVGQAPWYDRGAEIHLVRSADVVTSVSVGLDRFVHELGRESAVLLPNATKRSLIGGRPKPHRDGKRIRVGYFGHLSPAWFDWELMLEVAERMPLWDIDVIGYGGKGPRRRFPANMRFLGKQPHSALIDLTAEWLVGLVPFKAGPVARASDPIKVYEYLALGLPVVGKGFDVPLGAERFVTIAGEPDSFISAVESALNVEEDEREEMLAFARASTWEARCSQLQNMWSAADQRIREKRWLFAR